MDTKEVGTKLVALCKEGKNMEAIDTLYHEDVVSIEAQTPPDMSPESKGIDAIRGKNAWWSANHELHSASVKGPYTNGDKFSTIFNYEITPKIGPQAGKKISMEEVAVYTVNDGKIVREEFMY